MCHMIVRETGHEVVAVIVVRLQSKVHLDLTPALLCSSDQVLREQLALLVKIISSPLGLSVRAVFAMAASSNHIDENIHGRLPPLD